MENLWEVLSYLCVGANAATADRKVLSFLLAGTMIYTGIGLTFVHATIALISLAERCHKMWKSADALRACLASTRYGRACTDFVTRHRLMIIAGMASLVCWMLASQRKRNKNACTCVECQRHRKQHETVNTKFRLSIIAMIVTATALLSYVLSTEQAQRVKRRLLKSVDTIVSFEGLLTQLAKTFLEGDGDALFREGSIFAMDIPETTVEIEEVEEPLSEPRDESGEEALALPTGPVVLNVMTRTYAQVVASRSRATTSCARALARALSWEPSKEYETTTTDKRTMIVIVSAMVMCGVCLYYWVRKGSKEPKCYQTKKKGSYVSSPDSDEDLMNLLRDQKGLPMFAQDKRTGVNTRHVEFWLTEDEGRIKRAKFIRGPNGMDFQRNVLGAIDFEDLGAGEIDFEAGNIRREERKVDGPRYIPRHLRQTRGDDVDNWRDPVHRHTQTDLPAASCSKAEPEPMPDTIKAEEVPTSKAKTAKNKDKRARQKSRQCSDVKPWTESEDAIFRKDVVCVYEKVSGSFAGNGIRFSDGFLVPGHLEKGTYEGRSGTFSVEFDVDYDAPTIGATYDLKDDLIVVESDLICSPSSCLRKTRYPIAGERIVMIGFNVDAQGLVKRRIEHSRILALRGEPMSEATFMDSDLPSADGDSGSLIIARSDLAVLGYHNADGTIYAESVTIPLGFH
jgi:hypothetical protein